MRDANPIYILSKGRPSCLTAKTLKRLSYPSRVTIVCGDDDETIPDYVENFGDDMVTVFNKKDWLDKCDMMDAYGYGQASGISPVRNYIVHLARSHGYDRCWQFDDDFKGFGRTSSDGRSRVVKTGDELYDLLDKIEDFGRKCGIRLTGFIPTEPMWKLPIRMGFEVAGAHNISTSHDMPYRSRIFEDAVRMFDSLRTGEIEVRFDQVYAIMESHWFGSLDEESNGNDGGMHDQYTDMCEDGRRDAVQVRNVGYTTMALPMANVLRVNGDGKCESLYRATKYRPRILRQEHMA